MVKLVAKNLRRSFGDNVLFDKVSFELQKGESLVISGPSGTGKSQLLRLLAFLTSPAHGGSEEAVIGLEEEDGHLSTPRSIGVPNWRARVYYVAQDTPVFTGTPRDWFSQIQSYNAQKIRINLHLDPIIYTTNWNLPPSVWDQPMFDLSGGERQRIALSIALALRPDVLLLDEATNSLDPECLLLVEKDILESTSSLIWISHSDEQKSRVSSRILDLTQFTQREDRILHNVTENTPLIEKIDKNSNNLA